MRLTRSRRRSLLSTLPDPLATVALVAVGGLLSAGCTSFESSTSTRGDIAVVEVRMQLPSGQVGTSRQAPDFAVRLDEGERTLVVTEAYLVWDDMEFRQSGGECVVSETADDGDDCTEVFVEPRPQQLPTQTGELLLGSVALPPGTYSALQFALHPVQADETGLQGGQGKFEEGSSVSLIGSFREGDATTQFDPALFGPEGTVELSFGGGLTVEGGDRRTVTITVDLGGWFRDAEGRLIHPGDAQDDETAAALVRDRILQSFSLQVSAG